MNLGLSRIVIIAALVVAGVAVLASGFDGGGPASTSPSSGPSPTGATGPGESPTSTPTPSPEVEGVSVAAFNGTDQAGLAADVTLTLVQAGYTKAQDANDAPSNGVKKTIVYFRGGGTDEPQNRSNAALLAETLGGAKIGQLSEDYSALVTDQTDLVVVLGQDYADRQA